MSSNAYVIGADVLGAVPRAATRVATPAPAPVTRAAAVAKPAAAPVVQRVATTVVPPTSHVPLATAAKVVPPTSHVPSNIATTYVPPKSSALDKAKQNLSPAAAAKTAQDTSAAAGAIEKAAKRALSASARIKAKYPKTAAKLSSAGNKGISNASKARASAASKIATAAAVHGIGAEMGITVGAVSDVLQNRLTTYDPVGIAMYQKYAAALNAVAQAGEIIADAQPLADSVRAQAPDLAAAGDAIIARAQNVIDTTDLSDPTNYVDPTPTVTQIASDEAAWKNSLSSAGASSAAADAGGGGGGGGGGDSGSSDDGSAGGAGTDDPFAGNDVPTDVAAPAADGEAGGDDAKLQSVTRELPVAAAASVPLPAFLMKKHLGLPTWGWGLGVLAIGGGGFALYRKLRRK